jgi:hypothetical protein
MPEDTDDKATTPPAPERVALSATKQVELTKAQIDAHLREREIDADLEKARIKADLEKARIEAQAKKDAGEVEVKREDTKQDNQRSTLRTLFMGVAAVIGTAGVIVLVALALYYKADINLHGFGLNVVTGGGTGDAPPSKDVPTAIEDGEAPVKP